MVFIPLALAIMFAFILTPPVVWLRRKGLPRWPAALLVTAVACVLVVAACWVVTAQVRDLVVQLPQHSKTIGAKIAALNRDDNGFFKPVLTSVQELYGAVERGLNGEISALETAEEGGKTTTAKPGDGIPVVKIKGDFWSTLFGIAQPVLEMVVGAILVLVVVVFMLISREDLQYRLIRLVGHGNLTATTQALEGAAARTGKYLLTRSVINVPCASVL